MTASMRRSGALLLYLALLALLAWRVPSLAAPVPGVHAYRASAFELPQHGRIRFSISREDLDFAVGQAVHTWRRDGKHYSLTSVTETTGLAALFKKAQVVQQSEGEITDAGLQPFEFRTLRNGVAAEAASFDWARGRLDYTGGRQAPLSPGAQDVLSVFYQLGRRLPVGRVAMMVATGKKFERYSFEVLGVERLRFPFGEQRTLHLKSVGDSGEATEVWLGLDQRGLPLKIRYTDKHGGNYVQIAQTVEFDDNGSAANGNQPKVAP